MNRGTLRHPGSDVAFLVGAGRSGTTLLYKLLCLHPRVAYISNYENRFDWFPDGLAARALANRGGTKLRAWFDAGGNAYFVDRPWVRRLLPAPHEGERVFGACGVPLFPRPDEVPDAGTVGRLQRRFARLRRRAGAQLILSKRTANNRRIRYLATAFPAARFIHLVRDGREVAQSLSRVTWWDRHTIWWDGRTALEMERSGEPRLAICARNWVREVEEVRTQLGRIPAGRVHELRYEDLLRDPAAEVGRVARFLGLGPSTCFEPAIAALALRPARAHWASEWSAHELSCVLREMHPLLRRLGYAE